MSERRIALPDLLAATGYEARYLSDLRRREPSLFPFEPNLTHTEGVQGSTSDYAFEALDYLQRLAPVQRQFPRNPGEWFWHMSHDPAGRSLDIRSWVLARLDRVLDDTKRVKQAGAVLAPEAAHGLPGAGKVRGEKGGKSRRVAWDWIVAWALNNKRPELYSAAPEGVSAPSFYDLLLRLAGPPFEGLRVFRQERISKLGGSYWLTHFRRIVALAPNRDIEQAHCDWRAINDLIEATKRVDWNKVPAFTSIGAKPEPRSWADRRARRTRPKPPPDFIKLFIKEWHSTERGFDLRALLFSALLTARRLLPRAPMPGRPQLPDIMISIARQWLDGLPQLEPPSRPLEVEAHENEHAC